MSNSLTIQSPPPSPRDLEIYKRSVVFKHDQLAIAAHYDLGQPRISQIVNSVRQWLAAGGNPEDPEIRDHFAQQKLTRATQKIRLLRVIDMANYAIENRLPAQVTTKSRYHGVSEVWREEVRKQAPEVNLPAMRVLLRAVKTLDDLEANPDQAAPDKSGQHLSEDDLLQSVFDLLCRWRTRAEAAGRLPHAPDIAQCIADGLANLIGPTVIDTLRVASQSIHSPSSDDTQATDIPVNISATPELLIAPTTDQPSPCDK